MARVLNWKGLQKQHKSIFEFCNIVAYMNIWTLESFSIVPENPHCQWKTRDIKPFSTPILFLTFNTNNEQNIENISYLMVSNCTHFHTKYDF